MKNKRKLNERHSQNNKQNKRNMKVIEQQSSLLKLQQTMSYETLPRIVKPYLGIELNKNKVMRGDVGLERIKNKLKEQCVSNRETFDDKNVGNGVGQGKENKGLKRLEKENRKQLLGKDVLLGRLSGNLKNDEDVNMNGQLVPIRNFFNVIHNRLKDVKKRLRGQRYTFDSLDNLDLQIGRSKKNNKNYCELLKVSSFFDRNNQSFEMSPRKKIFESREILQVEGVGDVVGEIERLQRLHEDSESRLRMCMNQQLDIINMEYYLKLLRNV